MYNWDHRVTTERTSLSKETYTVKHIQSNTPEKYSHPVMFLVVLTHVLGYRGE